MTTSPIATARQSLLADLPVIIAAARNASTLKSNHVRGLRNLLTIAQDGTCAGCGESLAGVTVELAHTVPSTNARTGYDIAPGGVYAACKACNTYDIGKSAHEIVSSLARPDLVQRVHPSRQACLAASGTSVARVTAIRDAIANA